MESPKLVNRRKLAQLLNYTERQITRLQKHPECPGRVDDKLYDYALWRDFVDTYGRKSAVEKKAELEAERLEIHNERQWFKHECEMKQWTPNSVIATEITRLANEFFAALKHTFEDKLPPRLINRTPDEVRMVLQEEMDALLLRIHSGPAEAIRVLTPEE